MTANQCSENQDVFIPVRMLNEYVYCPRLAYLEWVQGEFAHSADTVEGTIRHKRVDTGDGRLPAADADEEDKICARSVALSSARLGISCRADLVEAEGDRATPVDYKKGKRPHVEGGAYAPEKVQLCAQGLLLREHGYLSDEGVLYFAGSRERVRVLFDDELIHLTMDAIENMKKFARDAPIPPPLEDSPKCPRCSLVGICLPDEVRFLNCFDQIPRPLAPPLETALPLYVQSPSAYLRKQGEEVVIEEKKTVLEKVPLADISRIVLHGYSSMTTPLLHECMKRSIPVTYNTFYGWFVGHTVGTGHKNVELRTNQYRASFDDKTCLKLARRWVAAKIANCRTLMRRNLKSAADDPAGIHDDLLAQFNYDIKNASKADSIDSLLGVEGASASRYFRHFTRMFQSPDDPDMRFSFDKRNRRPPKDPVNAMLSFGYSMLSREWFITLSAVGFDPYRGFYHKSRFGRPALALDMMEPFRPLVADSVVLTVVNKGEIRPDDFVRSAAGCNMNDKARKAFIAAFDRRMETQVTHPIFQYRISYRRLLEVQARLLGRYLAGEIPRYPNFVTR